MISKLPDFDSLPSFFASSKNKASSPETKSYKTDDHQKTDDSSPFFSLVKQESSSKPAPPSSPHPSSRSEHTTASHQKASGIPQHPSQRIADSSSIPPPINKKQTRSISTQAPNSKEQASQGGDNVKIQIRPEKSQPSKGLEKQEKKQEEFIFPEEMSHLSSPSSLQPTNKKETKDGTINPTTRDPQKTIVVQKKKSIPPSFIVAPPEKLETPTVISPSSLKDNKDTGKTEGISNSSDSLQRPSSRPSPPSHSPTSLSSNHISTEFLTETFSPMQETIFSNELKIYSKAKPLASSNQSNQSIPLPSVSSKATIQNANSDKNQEFLEVKPKKKSVLSNESSNFKSKDPLKLESSHLWEKLSEGLRDELARVISPPIKANPTQDRVSFQGTSAYSKSSSEEPYKISLLNHPEVTLKGIQISNSSNLSSSQPIREQVQNQARELLDLISQVRHELIRKQSRGQVEEVFIAKPIRQLDTKEIESTASPTGTFYLPRGEKKSIPSQEIKQQLQTIRNILETHLPSNLISSSPTNVTFHPLHVGEITTLPGGTVSLANEIFTFLSSYLPLPPKTGGESERLELQMTSSRFGDLTLALEQVGSRLEIMFQFAHEDSQQEFMQNQDELTNQLRRIGYKEVHIRIEERHPEGQDSQKRSSSRQFTNQETLQDRYIRFTDDETNMFHNET